MKKDWIEEILALGAVGALAMLGWYLNLKYAMPQPTDDEYLFHD